MREAFSVFVFFVLLVMGASHAQAGCGTPPTSYDPNHSFFTCLAKVMKYIEAIDETPGDPSLSEALTSKSLTPLPMTGQGI